MSAADHRPSDADQKPYIGRSIRRVEDLRFITGRGNYTDDARIVGEAHCVFVRSPHSHAKILGIDTESASAMPGVVAILTGKDYAEDGCLPIDHVPNPADAIDVRKRAFTAQGDRVIREQKHWPLAIDAARYLGEPVVAVIAESVAQAHDAAEAVEIHYTPLLAATSIADAIKEEAPQIWPDIPRNNCLTYDAGDAAAVDRAFAKATHLVRHTFDTNRIVNCQLEPRAAIGTYEESSGEYCLISGNQGVTKLQMSIAPALGIDKSKLRVICPDVGGGFGPRTYVYSEQVVVLWAAQRTRRAVRWNSTRSEAFLTDYQGRDNLTHATLALDKRGKALALRVEFYGAIGAQTVAYVTPANAMRMLTTVYKIPVAHGLIHAIVTNATPTAPYRGAGRPEANHFIERMFDLAARELKMDRAEIRRRNIVDQKDMPFCSAMGLTYDAGDFRGNMEQVLTWGDWANFKARRREARKRGKLAGIGVANHIEGPVGAPIERVIVSILPNGKVDVIVGTQSTGQGHETSFAQVMADQVGVPMDQIDVRFGDSAFVTLGGGTHSDRSLRIAGTLIVQAAEEIRDKARKPAAALLQCTPDELVFDNGNFRVSDTQRAVSLVEVARACASGDLPEDLRQPLTATKDFFGRIPAFPGGCAVCEVEIDPTSGEIEIKRYSTVDDVGLAVNPMIVEGQTHGGIVQGIGQALFEGVRFQDAQVITGSFMDYGIARASDVPSFNTHRAEAPTTLNPLRVKGAGEGGIAPVTAAVTSAICDALIDYGIVDLPMPITPAAVWQALQTAKANL